MIGWKKIKSSLISVGIVAVLISISSCGIGPVGVENPNGCFIKLNGNGELDHPHESHDLPGEISGSVSVECAIAPQSITVEMRMFRSPVGANDWELVGENVNQFGSVMRARANMHDSHIQCPGGNFDYQWAARAQYTTGQPGDIPLMSLPEFSRVIPIDC